VVWKAQRLGVRESKGVAVVDGGRLPAFGLAVIVGWLGQVDGDAVGDAVLIEEGQHFGKASFAGPVVVLTVLDVEGQLVIITLLHGDSGAEGALADGQERGGKRIRHGAVEVVVVRGAAPLL